MLLAEELALIALDPDSGRHALGTRDNLNACLAGLLVAELDLDDRPAAPILDAASEVVDEAGPKLKSVLSAMSRGLERRLGLGTWDALVRNLVDAQVVAPAEGGLRPAHPVLDRAALDASGLHPVAESVRKVLAEAAAAAAAAAVATMGAASSSC